MEPKKIFILWSGGLDSTYLIQKKLEEGYIVRAGYVKLLNNEYQNKAELSAIESMRGIFEKNQNFSYLGNVVELFIQNNYSNFILGYPPILTLLPFFISNVDEVGIGYVMNDDAISYLDDIKNLYYQTQSLSDATLPVLTFPLSKLKKSYILQLIDQNLLQYVSWCEYPKSNPCGTCPSCERMKKVAPHIFDNMICDDAFEKEIPFTIDNRM